MIKAVLTYIVDWATEHPLITLGVCAGAALALGLVTGLIGR
jgi:hypothetical protein